MASMTLLLCGRLFMITLILQLRGNCQDALDQIVLDGKNIKTTTLHHPLETQSKEFAFNALNLNRSFPQSARRLSTQATTTAIYGNFYLSLSNNSYYNGTLTCKSLEIYKPTGLEDDIVSVVTCEDTDVVLIVKRTADGSYKVSERTALYNSKSQAAIIVDANGNSAAIYVSTTNLLYLRSLELNSEFSILIMARASISCTTNWNALSYSDSCGAFYCPDNQHDLYIGCGLGQGSFTKVPVTFTNVQSLVIVYNNDTFIDITDYGVKIYWNNFNNNRPIHSQKICQTDYAKVDDTIVFFLFACDHKVVYTVNSTSSYSALLVLVNETNEIDFDSVYISSFLTVFAYVVNSFDSWSVAAINFVTHFSYPSVNYLQRPRLIDLRAVLDISEEKSSIIVLPAKMTSSNGIIEPTLTIPLISTTTTSATTTSSTTKSTTMTSIASTLSTHKIQIVSTSTTGIISSDSPNGVSGAGIFTSQPYIIIFVLVILIIVVFVIIGMVICLWYYKKNNKLQNTPRSNSLNDSLPTSFSSDDPCIERGSIRQETNNVGTQETSLNSSEEIVTASIPRVVLHVSSALT